MTDTRKPPVESLVGIALESAGPGQISSVLTQFELYNETSGTDTTRIFARSIIHGILCDYVYPHVLETFKGKNVPEDFHLYAAHLEMYPDELKNRIFINDNSGLKLTCRINKEFKYNDPICDGDVQELLRIESEKADPNAATVSLVQLHGKWYGKADLVYNRGVVRGKLDRAIAFLHSAVTANEKNNMPSFYESLWSSCELLAESMLLLYRQLPLKSEHKAIFLALKQFDKLHSLNFADSYLTIRQIRDSMRYGEPHPDRTDEGQKKAQALLDDCLSFFAYAYAFMKKRQVEVPDSGGTRPREMDVSGLGA